MIFLFVALPLVVAGILPLVGRISKKVLPDILVNGVLGALLALAAFQGRSLISQGPAVETFTWLGEPMSLRLALDGFSLLMLFTVTLVGLCITLFSINYMDHYG